MATTTLLIIDDNVTDIRLLSEMLRDEGYRLLVARNGRDGFERAVQSRPHLILLDLHMPVLDGHATARLFGTDARVSHIPIVMLTASAALNDKLGAFNEGVVDYITKPFSGEELVARVRVHLRRISPSSPPPAALNTATPTSPAATATTAADWDAVLVTRAQTILLQRLKDNLSLCDLAHEVGTNERRLTEAFRRKIGKAVFDYVRTERHRKACDLLLHSTQSVATIAQATGFGTAASFTYAFRSRYGLTPSQYRASGGLVLDEGAA